MIIKQLAVGAYETNCYILTADENAKKCVLVDLGLEAGPAIEFLKEQSLNPEVVIFTHGHADHIMGITDLRAQFPEVKTAVHTDDAEMMTNPAKNLSITVGIEYKDRTADIELTDGDKINYAGIELEVIHTPGHTPGGISLYSSADKVVFTGDALFAGSIGRTDFPGGHFDTLINSIRTKLLTLPGDTVIMPGHGPKSTISEEMSYNQFLV